MISTLSKALQLLNCFDCS